MKRSIGLRGHFPSITSGTGVSSSGMNDQWGLYSAPCSIQRRISSTCCGASVRFAAGGGIRASLFSALIRW